MPTPLDAHLISTKEASDLSGYNPDYLARLCRAGKIVGKQVGRAWVVDARSLDAFVREQDERKAVRAQELAREREREYRSAQQPVPAPRAAHAITTVKLAPIEAARLVARKPAKPLVFSPAFAFALSVILTSAVVYAGNSPRLSDALGEAGNALIAFGYSDAVTGAPHHQPTDTDPPQELAQRYFAHTAPSYAVLRDGLALGSSAAALHDAAFAVSASRAPRIDVAQAGADTGANLVASTQDSAAALAYAAAHPSVLAVGTVSTAQDTLARILRGEIILETHAGSGLLALGAHVRDTTADASRANAGGTFAARIVNAYADAVYGWADATPRIATAGARSELALGSTVLGAGSATAQFFDDTAAHGPTAAEDLALGVLGNAAVSAQEVSTPQGSSWNPNHLAALVAQAAPWFVPQPVFGFGQRLALAVYGGLHGLADQAGGALAMLFGNPKTDTQLTVIPTPAPIAQTAAPAPSSVSLATTTPAAPVIGGSSTGTPTYQGGTIVRNVTYVTNNFSYANDVVSRAAFNGSLDSLASSILPPSASTIAAALKTQDVSVPSLTSDSITATNAINGAYFTAASVTATSSLPNLVSNSFSLGSDYFTDFTGNGLVATNGSLGVSTTSLASGFFLNGGNSFGNAATLGTTDANPLTLVTNGATQVTVDASGNVGVGTTSPSAKLAVAGDGYFTGNLQVGNSLLVQNGSVTLGAASSTLTLGGFVGSSVVPSINKSYDLGSPALYWRTGYIDTLNVNTLAVASTSIGGTTNNSFTINSDNATADTEDMSLIFFRGVVNPNAVLSWNSAVDRFEFNQPAMFWNQSSTTTIPSLVARAATGQTADLFQLQDSTGSTLFNVTSAGKVGVGTTSTNATVNAADSFGAYAKSPTDTSFFAAYDENGTNFVALQKRGTTQPGHIGLAAGASELLSVGSDLGIYTFNNNYLAFGTNNAERLRVTSSGNVGIGTTSPGATLGVEGSALVNGAFTATGIGSIGGDLYLGGTRTATYSGSDLRFGYNWTSTSFYSNGIFEGRFTGGALGIGTSTPWAQLSVNPSGITGPAFVIGSSTGTSLYVGNDSRIGLGGIAKTTDKLSFFDDANTDGFGFYDAAGNPQGSIFLGSGTTARQFVVNLPGATGANGNTDNWFSIRNNTGGLKVSIGAATGHSWYEGSGDLYFAANTAVNANATPMLVIASTTGNVGIGSTTAPKVNLHIASGSAGGYPNYVAGADQLLVEGSTFGLIHTLGGNSSGIEMDTPTQRAAGYVLYTNSTNKLTLGTNNTDRVVIDSNGNVGIGTSTPAAGLQVNASQLALTGLTAQANNQNGLILFGGTNGGTVFARGDASGGDDNLVLKAFTDIELHTFPSGADTTRVVIKNNGNVGIGTTTPNDLLSLFNSNTGATRIGLTSSSSGGAFLTEWGYGGGPGFLEIGQNDYFSSAGARVQPSTNVPSWFLHLNSNTDQFTIGHATAGNIASPTFPLAILGSSGNVGINMASPQQKLDVGGTLRITQAQGQDSIQFFDSGSGMKWVQDVTGNALQFYDSASGTERVRFANGGNVGIGTTSPWAMLSVNPNGITGPSFAIGSSSSQLFVVDNNGKTQIGKALGGATNNLPYYPFSVNLPVQDSIIADFRDTSTNGIEIGNADFGSNGVARGIWGAGSVLGFDNAQPNGSIVFKTNNGSYAERLRIDSTGFVGIGTTSPSAKLDVFGQGGNTVGVVNIKSSPASSFALTATNGSVLGGVYIGTTGGVQFGSASNDKVGFFVNNGTASAVLDTTGNFGIGTSTPYKTLSVTGGVAFNTGRINIDNSAGTTFDFTTNTKTVNVGINSTNDFIVNDQSLGVTWLYENGGKLGVGNYFQAGNLPQNKLSVNGSASIGFPTNGDVAAPSNGLLVNGNVGIGTTSPAATLGVAGSIYSTGALTSVGTATSTFSGPLVLLNPSSSQPGGVTFADIAGNQSTSITGGSSASLNLNGTTLNLNVTTISSPNNINWGLGNRAFTITSGGTQSFGVIGGAASTVPMYHQLGASETANLEEWRNSSGVAQDVIAANFNVGIGTTSPMTALALGSGQLALPDGTAAAPSHAFGSDLTTGIYKSATAQLGFSTAGSLRATIDSAAIRGPLGNAGTPSIAFVADATTGLYDVAAGQLGFSTAGANRATLDSTGLKVNGNGAFGGTSIVTNTILQVASNIADPTGTTVAINGSRTLSLTANNSNAVTGGSFQVSTATSGFNMTGILRGGQFQVQNGIASTTSDGRAVDTVLYNTGDGIITNGYAAHFTVQNLQADGIITNGYGAYVGGGFNNGTINNLYGVYVDTLPSASTTYGFYENSTANNYFKGNVGIGTTSPGSLLEVVASGGLFTPSAQTVAAFVRNGSSASDAVVSINSGTAGKAVLRFGNPTTEANGIIKYDNSLNSLNFGTNGVNDLVTINSAGSVGIGTTSPYAKLSIAGSDTTSPLLAADAVSGFSGLFGDFKVASSSRLTLGLGAGNSSRIRLARFSDGAISSSIEGTNNARTADGLTLAYTGGTGEAISFDGSGGYIGFYTNSNNTERVRIDSSGNLGIGTTNPTAALHVVSNISSSTDQAAGQKYLTTLGGSQGGISTVYGYQTNTTAQPSGGSWGSVQGNFSQSFFAGTGGSSLTHLQGFFVRTGISGASPTGSIGNGEAIYIDSPTNQATTPSVTITNQYGLRIQNQGATSGYTPGNVAAILVASQTGASNNADIIYGQTTVPTGNFGIYQGDSYTNYLNGSLGVGSTTPFGKLAVDAGGGTEGLTLGNFSTGGPDKVVDAYVPNGVVGGFYVTNASTFSASFGLNGNVGFIGSTNATPVQLQTAGIARVYADTTGHVGIGTTTPWAALSVNPNGVSGAEFAVGSSSKTDLVVNNAGLVGIGTTNPLYGLHLSVSDNTSNSIADFQNPNTGSSAFADVKIQSDTANLNIGVAGSNTGTSGVVQDATYSYLEANNTSAGLNLAAVKGNGVIRFFTGGPANEVARFGSTGNFGIGTTSPFRTLSVVGTLYTSGAVQFANYGAGTLQTDSSGNVTVSSDERLKNIYASFSRGLSAIQGLNPILFHWNAVSGLNQTDVNAGFSAQNVQSVIPEAVGQDSRGYLTLQDRPILAAAVNAIKDLAGQTTQLSMATTSLTAQLAEVQQQAAAAQAAAQAAQQLPTDLTASRVSADTISAADTLTAGTVQSFGNVSAASFTVPSVAVQYVIGSSTIAVNLPSDVLTASSSVDLYKLATYSLARTVALEGRFDALSLKVDDLEGRVAALEQANASSTSIGLDQLFATSTAQQMLASVGFLFSNGFTEIKSLVADTLTVGTPQKPTGVTLYDEQTGQPYCVSIKNGQQQITQGACQVVDLAAQQAMQQQGSPQIIVTNGTVNITGTTTTPVTTGGTATTTTAAGGTNGGSTATTTASTGGAGSTSGSGDTTPPTVTLNGSAAMQISVGDAWNDPGATAMDAVDGDLTGAIAVSGGVNVNAPGLYTVTYSATDAAGNTGSISRTVVVQQASTATSATVATAQ